MNNFKRVSAVISAGVTLLCTSGASYGLGFGQPSSRAILGDTLLVTIPLRLESGEEITGGCLAADVFFGDEKVPSKAVFTEVMPGGTADRVVLGVKTTALINEPVVTVYMAAGCKARITRKVVALADPPGVLMAGQDAAISAEVGSVVQAVSLPAAAVLSAPGALPVETVLRQPATASSRASRRVSGQNAVASKAGGAPSPGATMSSLALGVSRPSDRKGVTSQVKAIGSARDGGARLQLDSVEADAMLRPGLRMTATMGTTAMAQDQSPDMEVRRRAAAALWLALNATPEQLTRDHQRLKDLEQRLAQLKQEGDKSREVVTSLQERARKAESAGSNVWLYGAGLLAFAGLALAGYFYGRLRQERKQQSRWWHGQPDSQQGTHDVVAEPVAVGEVRSAVAAPSVSAAAIHQHVPDAAPFGGFTPPSVAPSSLAPRDEPLREVSVEELIDLEQQAEFFVVLGQDEAAIDLLEGHVHNTTGASPLPFLKLLELYRRVGRRPDYERVQAQFNERFNAYAPSWDADLQHGHSLADYPGVVERLQALWASPPQAMEVLERSLTRPDSGEDTFELPAYRELLFLYAVARDLSERDTGYRDSVDLLLPVDDSSGMDHAEPVRHASIIEPLMATRPIKAQPEATPSISLDLHLDDLQAPEPDHKP